MKDDKLKLIINEKENGITTTTDDSEGNISKFSDVIYMSREERWSIFTLISLISLLSNISNGALSAATTQFQEELNKNEKDVGLFSSSDFIGRLIGSIIFLYIINKFNGRSLLIATLVSKAIFLGICTIPKLYFSLILIARGITGISQVFYTIYFPLWCDQFGTKKSRPVMVAITQIGCPLGIVMGYGACLLLNDWKNTFRLESTCLLLLTIWLLCIKNKYFSRTLAQLDNLNKQDEEKTINGKDNYNDNLNYNEEAQKPGRIILINIPESQLAESNVLSNLYKILCNMIFLCGVLPYSFSFYAMGAIKLWAPEYMRDVLGGKDNTTILGIFSAIGLIAPTLGLLFGGLVGRWIGGYTVKSVSLYCFILDLLGCAIGYPASLVNRLWLFSVMAWFFFFFSTAVIPLETGIIVSSIEEKIKGDAFSVTNYILNLIGNIPPSYIYGLIDDMYKNTQPKMAMKCVFYVRFASIAFLILGLVWRYSKKN